MAVKSLVSKDRTAVYGKSLAERVARAGGVVKVATMAGMDKGYVSHICKGNRSPSLDVLSKLAKALGTSMGVVVGEIEEVRQMRALGTD